MEIEFRHVEMARPSDESLPRVLGLYAPFRSFGWEKADIDVNNDLARADRKRKRGHSSVSSYLEPATFTAYKHAGESFCDQKKAPVSQRLHAELDDSASQPSSASPDTSALNSISREKPNKDYERRSRHRTRENRYELKEVKEAKKRKKKKNEDAPKKERKRKRKEKSGAALMHDFTAQNVAHNRLTVRLLLAIALRVIAVPTLLTDIELVKIRGCSGVIRQRSIIVASQEKGMYVSDQSMPAHSLLTRNYPQCLILRSLN